jgi:hypothetical protein
MFRLKFLKNFLTQSYRYLEMCNCDIKFFFIRSYMKYLWKHFDVERCNLQPYGMAAAVQEADHAIFYELDRKSPSQHFSYRYIRIC